jgi:hypothetical protein
MLKDLLGARPGVCAVEFEFYSSEGGVLRLAADRHVRADRALIEELQDICGPESVEVVRESARAAARGSYS